MDALSVECACAICQKKGGPSPDVEGIRAGVGAVSSPTRAVSRTSTIGQAPSVVFESTVQVSPPATWAEWKVAPASDPTRQAASPHRRMPSP